MAIECYKAHCPFHLSQFEEESGPLCVENEQCRAICFFCESDDVKIELAVNLYCLMGQTTLCKCGMCGAEWFSDLPK